MNALKATLSNDKFYFHEHFANQYLVREYQMDIKSIGLF